MKVVTTGRGRAIREKALQSLERLPPFSPILNRLLATVAKGEVSFAELSELIEKDTVVAGNVLRLVNSPLYSFRGTVNSVRHAVAILGLSRLRNFALSLSISRMWTRTATPPGWSGAGFNLHSVAVAVLADLLAEQTQVPYPEGGFVAGLLHDMGKLLIATSLPEDYEAIHRLLSAPQRSACDCELEVIAITHAELSGLALARWNLPIPIQLAASFHHNPDGADQGRRHLAHIVNAADALANSMGHSARFQSEARLQSDPAAALGISDRLPAILEKFEIEFQNMQSFF
jgi:HD-like signal output (HDOD) protein